MKNKILIVYQFATFGGVERILLNRAEAFKYFNLNYKMYLYFYEDFGALDALKEYILANDLQDFVEVIHEYNPSDYEFIVSIDTPQIFEDKRIQLSDIIIETHTIEKQYREYLDIYKDDVKKVIVPSKSFYNQLKSEYEHFDNLEILDNFVPWDIKEKNNELITLPNWEKNIIFYFGRIDDNKNIKDLILAYDYYLKNYKNDLLLLIVGNIDPEYKLTELIDELNLNGNIVILPPISFDNIPIFLNTMKKENAIFISSSKGETFGLSAAEAISYEIPVILSDIDAHSNLVDNKNIYLYEQGDIVDLSSKIDNMINNYNKSVKELMNIKESFSAHNFKKEWENIFPNKQ